jgi:tetratricopeptide (TPR) repeat protein
MTHSASKRAASGSERPGLLVRLLIALSAIVVLTSGIIGLVLWWDEQTVNVIQQSLDRGESLHALNLANKLLQASPDNVQALDQKARALVELRRWSDALPVLMRLNELSPDDGDVLYELCACQTEIGDLDESLRYAERLSQIPGYDRRGRALLGIVHYRRGNNWLAIQAWRPILEQQSDLSDLQVPAAEFLLACGRALLKIGRPAEALGPLERCVTIDPTADALGSLAEAYDGLGDRPRALALWEQAVARNPDDRPAREHLAETALENNSPAEAERWLRPLLLRDELTSSTAFLAQRAATLVGKKEDADKWAVRADSLRERERKVLALEQRARESPHSFLSRCVRAHRLASDGNLWQGLVLAEDLLKLEPDNPFIRALADAIRRQEPLPPLDSIPVELF